MDVFFQPTRGEEFSIEVGYFDTVLEIKEKIQKYQAIPISKQTLTFNGNVLQDDQNIHHSDIVDRSQIHIVVAAEDDDVDDQDMNDSDEVSSKKTIKLLLRMPAASEKLGLTLEMKVTDTIKKLKEKVNETEGFPIDRLIIQAKGIELKDHRTLEECELVDHSEVNVTVGSSSATSSGSSESSVGSEKIKVIVSTQCGKKIPIDVNPSEKVEVLKKELGKLNQDLNLRILKENYFFIFDQNVMEEDRTFRWHRVRQGDDIEIFSGTVTTSP